MPSMLRFRRGVGPACRTPAPEGPPAMSTILVTGASGFVGRHVVPSLLAGRPPRRRARPDPDGGRDGPRRASRRDQRQDVEIRIGDVTRPDTLAPAMAGVDAVVHLVAIPRDFNGGADLRLVNTEGTRAVVAAMREAGVRRLVHMGAMGVADDPTLHYASSKAKAEALVRDSGLGWTILKPSLQFGEGDGFFNIIAGLVRLSPGVVPVPGDGSARFQPIHVGDVAAVVVRVARRPDGDRRHVRARRPALLDVPRDHPRGPLRARQAAGHPADAGPAHQARGRDRGTRSTSRSRSPPTSSASSSSTTSARSTSSRRGSASSLARWRARSAISRTRSATRSPSPSDRPIRRGPHDPAAFGGRRPHLARDRRGHRARRGRPRRRARSPTRVDRADGPDDPRRRRGHPAARRGRGGIRGAGRPGRCARDRGTGRAGRPERLRPGRRRGGDPERRSPRVGDHRPAPSCCAARSPTSRTSARRRPG